jgi:Fic family protein
MAKQKEATEFAEIINILKAHPEGLSIGELLEMMELAPARRTLSRRLDDLIAQELVDITGQKRTTRYHAKRDNELESFSTEAQALKLEVKKPLLQRKPVAYQSNFLFDYQANKTAYLSESERQHLHEQGRPFNQPLAAGTYAKRILNRLLIDLSWNSSRLEGNTYSLLETEKLLEFGAEAEGKNLIEAQMILNHKAAIEFLVEQIELTDINKQIVLSLHALLSDGLLVNPRARGQLRKIPVAIGKSVYHPPEIPQVIDKAFQHLVTTAAAIQDPFEQAFFLMVQLPYLQPFEDVNKRTSRLSANFSLLKNSLAPLSFIDVPKEDYISGLLAIYELNNVELMKEVFLWAYERSAQHYKVMQNTLGEPNILQMKFRKELFELVNAVVQKNLQAADLVSFVSSWSQKNIPPNYAEQFSLLAERELASLHEGNIAIYKLPTESFIRWKADKEIDKPA